MKIGCNLYCIAVSFCILSLLSSYSVANCDFTNIKAANLDNCVSFERLMQHGLSLKDSGRGFPDKNGLNNYQKAQMIFEQAIYTASSLIDQSGALARYGEILYLQKQPQEALNYLSKGRRLLGASSPEWMNKLALKIESKLQNKPKTKESFVRGLARIKNNEQLVDVSRIKPAASNVKLVQSSIEIKLNFITNSTDLDSQTQSNLDDLGQALISKRFLENAFLLVGHTDKRGSSSHNLNLSKRRAAAIQQRLITAYPSLKGRLLADGKGENELLYFGDTEKEHRFNRRLEVVIE